MNLVRRLSIVSMIAAVGFCLSPAYAADLRVRDAWVHATVPGQPVAGAYLTLRSPTSARLVSLRSDVSSAVEIHDMSIKDGVMRMRRVETLHLVADQEIRLAPGGMHLMLIGLRRPLLAGEHVDLELTTVADDGKPSTTQLRLPVQKASLP